MNPTLFWLDLETTGLDPHKDKILEIAVARTTLLVPFSPTVVYHHVLRFPIESHKYMHQFVREMHTKNGLLSECADTTKTMKEAEAELLEIIPHVSDREMMPILAGSGVHFDHEFLKFWMPELASRFSHRHYDVSAVKLFCRSLGMERILKAEAHRAVADIEDSVTHARECAKWLASCNKWMTDWRGSE
jgi:oligoribonuclease